MDFRQTVLLRKLADIGQGMCEPARGVQNESRSVVALQGEREQPPGTQSAGDGREDRRQFADIDEDVTGNHQIAASTTFLQRSEKVGVDELVINFSLGGFLKHPGGQIDSDEDARVRAERRSAQAGSASQVEDVKLPSRRGRENRLKKQLGHAVGELVEQVLIEVGCVAVKKAFNIAGRGGWHR